MEVAARSLVVANDSQVTEARRVAAALAVALGFDDTDAGTVALAATEVATNLVKHGGGGEFIVRGIPQGPEEPYPAVELLALDKGPGMLDVGVCVSDGYSTAGSHGIGLGAVARASATFDVYSRRGLGTVLLSRIVARRRTGAPQPGAFVEGVVCVPYPGEPASGDTWAFIGDGSRGLLLMADGLGHGMAAALAVQRARDTVLEHQRLGPAQLVEHIHDALRSTRGAAVAITEVDLAGRSVRHCGVGNIGVAIIAPSGSRQLVSHNGSAGHGTPRIQEFAYAWPEHALLVAHSDGLTTRWRLDVYPGLQERHPGVIAGVLYRDAKRGRDDVTVFAMRAAA